MSTVAVIMAAGLGTRMKSQVPKVLHPVLGDASLLWVLRALPPTVSSAVLILHHGKEQVEAALAAWQQQNLLPCPVCSVDQGVPLGTGHAVRAAAGVLDQIGAQRVLILSGDVPLIQSSTIERLTQFEAALMAMTLEDPSGYGRVLSHADGTLKGLVEHKDASPEIRAIQQVNGGAYALPWNLLKPALEGLSNANAQGEYYLTDAVVAVASKIPVQVELCTPEEMTGMNSRLEQAVLNRFAQQHILQRWMAEGVSVMAPEATYVGPRVLLARDVTLDPNVRLEGQVTVEEGTRIGQGCVIQDCQIGAHVEIRPYCIAKDALIGSGVKLGPFAHLREGTVLEEDVHIGNFVETKKTLLRKGAKANHLSYLGDAEVGERTNVGAGLITCNYDGFRKHRTLIGKDAFVGSDCQLVAPVTIGDGAILGAGSTITSDIPSGALALTRAQLVVREGGAERLRDKLKPKVG